VPPLVICQRHVTRIPRYQSRTRAVPDAGLASFLISPFLTNTTKTSKIVHLVLVDLNAIGLIVSGDRWHGAAPCDVQAFGLPPATGTGAGVAQNRGVAAEVVLRRVTKATVRRVGARLYRDDGDEGGGGEPEEMGSRPFLRFLLRLPAKVQHV
jgi:hypothetical protein